jgi:hypothetical protein
MNPSVSPDAFVFPAPLTRNGHPTPSGIRLREYVAIAALQGILAGGCQDGEIAADRAIEARDAFFKALESPSETIPPGPQISFA